MTRGWWLFAGAAGLLFGIRLGAQNLAVRLDGDTVRVSAPRFHFVEGKALERLQNGATVNFMVQLSLLADSGITVKGRDIQRFAISYDLWEEKFSVVRPGAVRRAASHLAATAAESWCIDQMNASVSGLSPEKQFSVRLEVRAEDPKEATSWSEPGFSFGRLIEIFSRPARGRQLRWIEEAGPFRLIDLRLPTGRGPGAG
jgi:hypothetical protein